MAYSFTQLSKDWAGTINGFMAKLYEAVRGDPTTAKFRIVGRRLRRLGRLRRWRRRRDFLSLLICIIIWGTESGRSRVGGQWLWQ